MTLAAHVRILGRGPGRSRSLSREEARQAMAVMLSGDAAPEAVGALLMLMRMKGETAAEIAGLAEGAQARLAPLPHADLDWPSYAAGRTRGLPWFLLAARLVAMAGHRVVLHGRNGADGAVRDGLRHAGIRQANDPEAAAACLDRDRIVYLPLESLSPALCDLLGLRAALGLRSCINTVCRMLNPARARSGVQGVFHPSYRLLQADAARLLGWDSLSVIKGGGGEVERHPAKSVAAFGLRNGAPWQRSFQPLVAQTRPLDDGARDPARLSDLWQGHVRDPFAEAVVTGTASLVLDTLGVAASESLARQLWSARDRAMVA